MTTPLTAPTTASSLRASAGTRAASAALSCADPAGSAPVAHAGRRATLGRLLAGGVVAGTLALTGCAALPGQEPVKVNVVGVEPATGEGLELRFIVKLRVQNPNDSAVDFDGVSLDLDVNGRNLASGVSDVKGVVPRFGETLFSVPVSVSAFSAVRQALGLTDLGQADSIPFVLRGRLAGGPFGGVRFVDQGKMNLRSVLSGPGSSSGGSTGTR